MNGPARTRTGLCSGGSGLVSSLGQQPERPGPVLSLLFLDLPGLRLLPEPFASGLPLFSGGQLDICQGRRRRLGGRLLLWGPVVFQDSADNKTQQLGDGPLSKFGQGLQLLEFIESEVGCRPVVFSFRSWPPPSFDLNYAGVTGHCPPYLGPTLGRNPVIIDSVPMCTRAHFSLATPEVRTLRINRPATCGRTRQGVGPG